MRGCFEEEKKIIDYSLNARQSSPDTERLEDQIFTAENQNRSHRNFLSSDVALPLKDIIRVQYNKLGSALNGADS